MVDTRPFKVGENLAVTPGQVIHRSDAVRAHPVRARAARGPSRRPLVVIPPQINKYYISDLAPGRSFVEHAVAAGIPYFAISWRNPTPAQRDWDLDTYVAACKEAIEVACDVGASERRQRRRHVRRRHHARVPAGSPRRHRTSRSSTRRRSWSPGSTSPSESTVGLLTSAASIEAARARSQRKGVLDGRDLGRMFAWLRPNDLVWNYWVNNYLLGAEPARVRHPLLERRHDQPPGGPALRLPRLCSAPTAWPPRARSTCSAPRSTSAR